MHRRRLFITLPLVPLLLASTLTGAASADTAADSAPQQYEVDGPGTPQERTEVAETGAAIDEAGDGTVVITADPGQAAAVEDLGYEVTPLPGPGSPGTPGVRDFPPEDSDYHNYDELTDVVDQVVADHPDLALKTSAGTSHEGRDLIAVKLSANVETDEAEPEVLFTHSQHAREHLTVEMAVYLLETLTDGYGSDARITELLDGREIWILPNVNPDGSEYDIETGSYRSWRKNRQPNEGSSAIGTDLNRNWAYNWGCCGGSSGDPSSITYRGSAGESATEVNQVADFVRGRVVDGEQQITAAIDFHTYSELILWPYGYTYGDVAPGMTQDDYDTHAELGRLMADGNGYTPQQSSDLYITDGSINDWLWADQGIFSYTYEMYPGSESEGGFYPPDDVIGRETERNHDSVLDLIDYADCPYRIIGEEQQYCS
ncbi:M14 family metallopeptidase [Nocardiopsis sediminis]|uniref:M14 family metallopeptidase n=1 Tax=Nocardiopsis sediminis TaxID=1778267 RepID=A0ABV8FJE5_9ACTN